MFCAIVQNNTVKNNVQKKPIIILFKIASVKMEAK